MLHFALQKWNNEDAAKILVNHESIQMRGTIYIQNKHGETPLSLAEAAGFHEIAESIIQMINATANVQDSNGQVPLHRAINAGDLQVCLLYTSDAADE